MGYTLRTQGAFHLEVPLSDSGDLVIAGAHIFDSDEHFFHVDGSIAALGHTYVSGDITITDESASFTSQFDLGESFLGLEGLEFAQEVALTLTFSPPGLCAQGATHLVVPDFGEFDGDVAACIGAENYLEFSGEGWAGLFGTPLAEVDVSLNPTDGLQIAKAFLQVPGIFQGNVAGYFKSLSDFEFLGSSTIGFPHLVSLESDMYLSPQAVSVDVKLNPNCPTCVVQSSMSGMIDASGGDWTYSLEGAGVIRLGGFVIADSLIRISDTEGIRASGTVNLGIGSAAVEGTVDTSTGDFSLVGTMGGSLLGGLITTAGAATISNEGASVSGSLGFWGSTGSFSTSLATAGGSVSAFSLTSAMNLAVPTAAGSFPLSNSSLSVYYTPSGTTANVSGLIQWLGASASVQGSVTPQGYSLSGTFPLGLPSAPVGSAALTLTPQKCTLSAAAQIPGFPAVTITGEVAPPPATHLQVSGTVRIGDTTYPTPKVTISTQSATFSTSLALGTFFDKDLGTAEAALSLQFATMQLCGTVTFPFLFETVHTCTAGICFGGSGGAGSIQLLDVECDGFCLGDEMCAPGQFCSGLGSCFPKKALDQPCAGLTTGDHECVSGFCDIWKTFPVPVCAVPLPDGIGCVGDAQCLSGHCGSRPGSAEHRCFSNLTQDLGQECYDLLHCAVGECWGTPTWPSRCLCVENAECQGSPSTPPGSVCKLGAWGLTPLSGLCVPARASGEVCLQASECQPGLLCGNGKCYAPASKHNWEPCVTNAECVSGQECWAGVCRCDSHAKCAADSAFGAGSFCDLGDWLSTNQEGRCHAPKAGLGAYCEDNAWCQSGTCAGGLCIQIASKSNWQVCTNTAECVSGQECWAGRCRCDSHAKCAADSAFGPNSFCDLGDWFPTNQEGRCHSPKSGLGAYCEDNTWCQSGLCAAKLCAQPASKHNWQTCGSSSECVAGQECWAGRCRCDSHAKCAADSAFGANSYCDLGDWLATNEEGRCHGPKRPSNTGQYCEDGAWCQSGLCTYSGALVHKTCYTHAGWPFDTPCTVNQQCANGTCVYWLFSGYYCN